MGRLAGPRTLEGPDRIYYIQTLDRPLGLHARPLGGHDRPLGGHDRPLGGHKIS